MNQKDCDERQKAIRNGAFRHGLIFTLCVVLADGFLADCGIQLAEGIWGRMLLVAAAITVVYQEMLWRDAIDYDDVRMLRFCSFLGIVGMVLMLWGIVDLVGKGMGTADFVLPKQISELLAAICWTSIGVTFWIRRFLDKKSIE